MDSPVDSPVDTKVDGEGGQFYNRDFGNQYAILNQVSGVHPYLPSHEMLNERLRCFLFGRT